METLTILFQNKLSFNEIPFFRGALLHSLPSNENTLLHNHIESGYRYSYPLIQYKSIDGKAALVCINEGIDSVMKLMSKDELTVRIGKKSPQQLSVRHIVPLPAPITIDSRFIKYDIQRWIPFNSDNYSTYKAIECLSDRILFLEKLLTANILSLLKGIGIHLNQNIECRLLTISKRDYTEMKGIKVMTLDASFQTQVSLPDNIGLGKHVSLGFGNITRK